MQQPQLVAGSKLEVAGSKLEAAGSKLEAAGKLERSKLERSKRVLVHNKLTDSGNASDVPNRQMRGRCS